jgi:alpha-glucosidase
MIAASNPPPRKTHSNPNDYMHRIHPSSVIFSFASLALLLLPGASLSTPPEKPDRTVASPNGGVVFELLDDDSGGLQYQVGFGKHIVIEPSRLGIVIDGVNLATDARVEKVDRYKMKEPYATRGVSSTAVNHCRVAEFHLAHGPTDNRFILEVRAFDDGIAFRYIVPGDGTRTPEAGIEFKVPAGSTVWCHGLGGHYEGVHTEQPIEDLSENEWIAPPMTFKLPRGAGYAAITEAALVNYAGMALQAGENGIVRERLGHSQPIGTPFRLRFSKEDGERLSQPAAIEGDVITPWRVVMIGKDLNALVNCDILESLSPLPDNDRFPKGIRTKWVKPGRCVWKFLDGGESDLQSMMEFSRWAGELGFEYNLIEGFWQRWSEQELRSLVETSREYNVGIWLWKDSRALRTPEARKKFFTLCRDTGVVGAKIDFFDHEAKETIDLYGVLLKEAAEHQLMINFHGANKPTGEARTWPNELTREGVRGLEARRLESRSAHNATLPFTRYLAGHGDYTPVVFGERRGDTSATHQIATAAIFTSPLLVYGCYPERLLEHPAVDMIKSIPSVWDETIVLPQSEIGRVAAFARRHGDQWFLAVLGGPNDLELQVSLSFLDSGSYRSMLVRDVAEDPTAVAIENSDLTSADSLQIELVGGGGFIGRFSRASQLSVVNPPQN